MELEKDLDHMSESELRERCKQLETALNLREDQMDKDYRCLAEVLTNAYKQAAFGKGKDRHARGNPFDEQHMQTISSLLLTDRGMAFQAIKKLTEGLDLVETEAWEKELLGAINYIAGIIIWRKKGR